MSELPQIASADSLEELNSRYASLSAWEILEMVLEWFPGEVTFANSFGLEDVAVQHMLMQIDPEAETFVLDTGRLPQETYDLMERWRLRSGKRLRYFSPKAENLEPFITENGPNPFYQSIELRKECCAIRKIEPLSRALDRKKAWITGLRKEQSTARSELRVFEWDESYRLKVNPLTHWSLVDLWAYVRAHDVPYNRLHDQGFPSVGCAPCTRAVVAGENIRSGRWWWEVGEKSECGLHSRREVPIHD